MHSPDRHASTGAELLRLARRSIEHGLVHGEPLPVDNVGLPPALRVTAATFTTLKLDGELRGCCGGLEAVDALATDVARSAFSAAFRDSRFEPVHDEELDAIRVEVAVLSPLEVIAVANETELLNRLSPGEDGLVIIDGGHRATFLPKVWDSLPEPRRFLTELKAKCGLPADYWSKRLEFLRYRTISYAETGPQE